MAKLTELILMFQKYYNEHGDMQVVFRFEDDNIVDILSTGLSYADNINDEKVKVCWLKGYAKVDQTGDQEKVETEVPEPDLQAS